MRNRFQWILSIVLAAVMLLQCFSAGAVLMDDPELPEPPEETVEPTKSPEPEETPEPLPETDAPTITEALVRRSDEESASVLRSGMTLKYQTAVFHFVFSDPVGESGLAPSGVDLAACALSIDGRRITSGLTDESDMSLTASATLGNGKHLLRVTVCDHNGNQAETEYLLTVDEAYSLLPVYTVVSNLDYAPLGGRISITIHTSNAEYLSALNVMMIVDPMSGEDAFEIEAGQGFMLDESSVLYDSSNHMLQFRVRANMKLTGGRDVATVTFRLPSDLEKGSVFRYEIPGAWAETRSTDLLNYCEGFSLPERNLPVEAPYTLTVDDLYAGMTEKAYFHVTDHAGNMVQNAQIIDAGSGFIGLTNWSGQFTVPGGMLTATGNYVFYASGDLGCSFPVSVSVAETVQDLESEITFRAQGEPTGSKTVSWLSSIHDHVYLRWAESPQALNNAEIHDVSASLIPFGTTAVQINTCTITGLQPGQDGYLQISYDQKDWSVMEVFSSGDFTDGTRFSLLGSLAWSEESRLQDVIDSMAAQSPQIAVQLGDAVQNAASADEWVERLNVLDALGSADLLLVPGEKTAGRTASAVAAQPEKPYSYQYGNVYFAVIPGAVNAAALDWLARDAAQSKCLWKVLLTAEPIAESDQSAVEQAGIHVVFSDGAYTRTPPLTGGEIAESYDADARTSLRGDGVVYVTCGDLAQEAVFVSAEATQNSFVMNAMDGAAEAVDSFTMLASSCSEDGHRFSAQSVYNHDAGTIVCNRCGQVISARESGYTGFVSMEEGRAYLDHGTVKTGWFYADGTLLHAGEDARVHQTMDFSTETCTEDGVRMAWCVDCRMTHSYGTAVSACGHHYDEGHHCTNTHFDEAHKSYACGWIGIDISGLGGDLEYLYGYYSGAALMPAATVKTADGAELDAKEFSVSYVNNTEIGMAYAKITGVNSYYGELTLPFEIRPCDVETIRASEVGQTQLTLSWDAAPGAQRYAVYQQTATGWRRLGDTTALSYTVTGLTPAELYTFRVRPFAAAEFAGKRLDGSLDRTFWAAHHSESLSVRTEGVRFVDVPEWEWYAAPVQWAVDQGITNGTDLNRFSPENDCTRGQMVTFLWRAKGCPEPTMRSSPFSDVNDPDAYYYKAVLWAVEQGITRGSSLTTFSPDAPVTRGMVVTFLHRAAGSQTPVSRGSPFVDVVADQYYAQSVQWAVEHKITNGMDDTHFAPDQICTRAQIVTFLYRFMTNK